MASPSGVHPPEYGSDEWRALPADHPLRHEAVVAAAEAWLLLIKSPHVAELMADWVAWDDRRAARSFANEVCVSACRFRLALTPSFAELRRRRAVYRSPALSPGEIRARAAESWAAVERDFGRSSTGRAA